MDLQTELQKALVKFDIVELQEEFKAQNEFLAISNFLDLNSPILAELLNTIAPLQPLINRNYIPKHKKGGSISRFDLDQNAPIFNQFYQLPSFWQFLENIVQQKLLPCPQSDPHTYALYYYTEQGDHIQYHYDTSYYEGQRYTILLGLVDRSSCQLEYQLYRDDPQKETETAAIALNPGMLVIFNGDKLYHRVTPLGANEERIVLTMEYVTNPNMGKFKRFVSNMKDAIAYFGFRQVFRQS